MMIAKRPATIRLSRFGAATPHHTSAESMFSAWRSGQYPVPVPTPEPGIHLWNTLTTQAIIAALPPPEERHDCGLILATAKGDMEPVETWLDLDGQNQQPPFPPLLSDSLQTLADQFGLAGPKMVVSTACSSGLTALIEAAMMVQMGEARQMIVCAADIAGGFIQDGFQSLKAITPSRCRPFDRRRAGLTLGSAAAACLVEAVDDAAPGFHGPRVILEGWGLSSDATHLTAPDRNAFGLIRAIRQSLANIETGAIDAVMLHGTGTAYNDAMEALAMQTIFPHRPYITAAKGFLGHTLGASGVIETALAAWILHHHTVPAITGLEEPQWPELNFVHGRAQTAPLRRILKTASGFGGLNAAIVLKREGPMEAL